MAEERQKVIVLLTLLKETCSASIVPLRESAETTQPPSNPVSLLRKDFLSLLTLVYTSATRISLVLRPSEPAYSASQTPIREITAHVSGLTTCATLFDAHGKTLAETVRRSAIEVCETVASFAQGFLNTASSSSDTQSKEDYLVRTGAVHECIERIRKNIPESNLAAVKAHWSQDRSMLDDSLAEVTEMIEDIGGEEDEGSDDEGFGSDDDLLDGLGLGATKKLSAAEVDRVKKIHPLFRLTTLFYKRVSIDVLTSTQENLSQAKTRSLDALPLKSRGLLTTSDDLVATLYAPHKPPEISAAVSSFVTAFDTLYETLQTILPPPKSEAEDLASQLSEVTIQGTSKKGKDVRKWFDTCYEQFHKMSTSVVDLLSAETNTT
ncbi:hypothetical protein NLI96_g14 [Meripilus lineatus]|uniref:Uncharacterized protein n=1 Tax=Meripilus lineatus TaxID=2056292 RepID=A0AAD5VD76_9APHY|nr:hypothetical protein NLI96_g14 [Physisporinus lineatus]